MRKRQQCLWKIFLTTPANCPTPSLTAGLLCPRGSSPLSTDVPAAGHTLGTQLSRVAPPRPPDARSTPSRRPCNPSAPAPAPRAPRRGRGPEERGVSLAGRAGGGAGGPVWSCDLRVDLPERWVP